MKYIYIIVSLFISLLAIVFIYTGEKFIALGILLGNISDWFSDRWRKRNKYMGDII